MNRHTRIAATERRFGDRAYVMVLTSLILVPLLGFTGFAVDIGAWYARASSLQKASDAAALAGVVWQPDFAIAESVARDFATKNGFTHGVDGIEIYVTDPGANRLEVKIVDTDIDLYFASLFINSVEIGRQSTAEYLNAVSMGSPENFLGNDPILGDSPNYWLATFGPQTTKRSGDRYHTEVCGGAINCTGNSNDEFAVDGYFFTVDVTALQASSLNFEVFDPVHHNYGDRCTGGSSSNGNGGDWLFDDGTVAAELWYSTNQNGLGNYPEERYEVGGSGNPGGAAWCPGDNGLNGTNYQMSVIVRAPDATPFNNFDNEVICWTRWGNDQPNDQAEFVSDLLDNTGRQPGGSGFSGSGSAPAAFSLPFRDTYREWSTHCTDFSPQVGQYHIQIRTNADTADPTLWDPAIATKGRNRYSIRAGFGSATSPTYGDGISTFADGRLPIYVNVPPGAPTTCSGSPTCFYIARVPPEYAGHRLQLDMYDLTDGSALDVKFVPPPDSGLGVFSSCDFVLFDEGGGTVDLVENDCEATATDNTRLNSGGSNGDSIAAIIDIPAGYTCNISSTFGCWVTVEMNFAGSPNDTTTWSAKLGGDPIRLVE